MCITESTSSSLTEYMLLSWSREIDDEASIFYIGHDRPDWDFEDRILCICPVHLLSGSASSTICSYHFRMAISYESRLMGRSAEYHITTITTITTEWSSFRYIFLSSPGDDSVSAISSLTGKYDLIDEHSMVD